MLRRADGELLRSLDHHEYIVWCVRIWDDRIFSASYDCSVAVVSLEEGKSDVVHRIKGPDSWADAIGCDRRWRYLAIHDDINYELQIVSLSELIQSFRTDSSSTITYVQDKSNNMTIFKGQRIDYDYFTLQSRCLSRQDRQIFHKGRRHWSLLVEISIESLR